MNTSQRNRTPLLHTAIALLCGFCAAQLSAANTRAAYVTAAVGSSNYFDDGKYQDFEVDEFDVGWSLFGGYHFIPYFALEAGYTDFGDFRAIGAVEEVTERFSALYLACVGQLPLSHRWRLYGKLGVGAVRQQQTFSAQPNDTADSAALLLGIGTQWTPTALSRWAVIAGLDTYSFAADQAQQEFRQSLGLLSLGARLRF